MNAKEMLVFLNAPPPIDMEKVVFTLKTCIHNITNHGDGWCVYGYGWERDVIVAALARYLKKLCWEKIPSELCDEFRSIVRSAAFHLMWWLNRHNFAPFISLKFVALSYLWPHKGSTTFLEERFVVEHESQFPLIYYGIELGYDGQKTLLDF